MRKLKIRAVILVILLALLCTGCYDDREIDETAYIIALGIDVEEDNEYKYTFQFSAPLGMEGGGGEEEASPEKEGEGKIKDSGNSSVKNVVIKAPDFYIAKNMLNNFLSKNIDMSHLKLIVFSKETDSGRLIKHSQLFLREREVRPHTSLAVSEGSAEEFIRSVNPELEVNTAKYYELMSLRSNNIYAPSKRLRDFVEESARGGSSVLPVARVTKYDSSEEFEKKEKNHSLWVNSGKARISSSRADMRGMAIFRNGELKRLADGDEALVFNILNRDIQSFMISVKNRRDGIDTATFRIYIPRKAAYEIKSADGKSTVSVDLTVDAEYIGGRLPDGYDSYEELYGQLKQAMSEKISGFMYSLANGGTDIMNIGNVYKKKFLTNEELKKANWQEEYKNVEFKINLKVT